jgi:hypothetical protein
MTRVLVAVGAALALLIGGLSLAVVLGSDEDDIAVDNPLSENLTRAIALAERESGGRVDLRRYVPGAWDDVIVVARGAPREAISEALGHEWTGDDFPTGEQLIFLQGDRVVRFADYRGLGVFEGFALPVDIFPRDQAVLRVRDLVISPARGTPG